VHRRFLQLGEDLLRLDSVSPQRIRVAQRRPVLDLVTVQLKRALECGDCFGQVSLLFIGICLR